jgi:hypothetical protein
MLIHDLPQATRFLSCLDPDGLFTFQTIPNSNAGPRPTVMHGSFDQHAEWLTGQNDQGAGIFVMVNAGDGVLHEGSKTCRTAANVTRIRALFVDLDGAPIGPVLGSSPPPDWVVQSSPNRWHAYWTVDNCPLDLFGPVQSALAERFSGDRFAAGDAHPGLLSLQS